MSDKLEHYKYMLDNLKLSEQHLWWIKAQIREIEGEGVKQ